MAAKHQPIGRQCGLRWAGFAVSGVLFASILVSAQAVSQSATAEPFRIGTSATGVLAWMAEDLGFFEQNDADVEVQEITSGVEALDLVQSGKIDLGASSEFAFISRAVHDPSLCIYATISASRTVRLLSLEDRVSDQAADLRGKRIGVTFGSASRFFLWQFLVLSGISENEVTLVDMKPNEIVDAMATGTVDAGIVWEPHVTDIRNLVKVGLVEYLDQSEQHYYFTLHGRCDLEERKPEQLRRALRALVAAEQSAFEQSDAAQEAFARRFGISKDDAARIWDQHTLIVSLPQDLLFLMELQAEWRVSAGLDAGAPLDSLKRIKTQPLSDVAPNAVQIIR